MEGGFRIYQFASKVNANTIGVERRPLGRLTVYEPIKKECPKKGNQ